MQTRVLLECSLTRRQHVRMLQPSDWRIENSFRFGEVHSLGDYFLQDPNLTKYLKLIAMAQVPLSHRDPKLLQSLRFASYRHLTQQQANEYQAIL